MSEVRPHLSYTMPDRKEKYKLIKYVGIVSFIPFILVSGPLAGYLIGDFLRNKFKLNHNLTSILVIIGLIASIRETIVIILRLAKMERK